MIAIKNTTSANPDGDDLEAKERKEEFLEVNKKNNIVKIKKPRGLDHNEWVNSCLLG